MDRLQTLRVYARVAELRSFTRAAESLGIPKASVSTLVQSLENDLGTRLLSRTTRSVQVTSDGEAFYQRCKDLLADMDELRTMFQKTETGLSGRLRVDMPSRFARFQVIPNLQSFLSVNPRIEIELGSTDREVDLIREGYDCVIRVGEMNDSSLISRRVGILEIISCASPAYLRSHGRPRSLADLSRHFLVHYVSTFGEKPEGFEYADGDGFRNLPMKGAVTVNNAEAYVAACLAGLGVIQAPRLSLEKHLERGELSLILPRLKAEPMPVSIVYPHQRNLPRRTRVFMDWIQSLFPAGSRRA